MFTMFDTFQEALYSNDPAINRGGSDGASDASSNRSGGSIIDRALGRVTPNAGLGRQDVGNNKVMYEESILMTLLGPDYM